MDPERGSGVVWVIGSDHWPRAYLRAELIERGVDAIGFVTLRDALVRLVAARSGAPHPALVIIDLHDQTTSDRALSTLLSGEFPVIAIGGAAEWADQVLRARPWALSLRRPITIGAVADAAQRLLAADTASIDSGNDRKNPTI
jgi:hypothetical protein